MKKIIVPAILPWLLMAFGHKALAQDTSKATDEKKESQEIIIRKKGGKDVTLNLQFTDDKVIVNGKPLIEFNDDGITINKKKVVISRDKLERDINNMVEQFHFEDFGKGTLSFSSSQRPFLGVSTEKTEGGAKIVSITRESPAEKAGLEKDDIITKINNDKVIGPEDLFKMISKMKADEEIRVSYQRGNKKEKTVKAVLKETKESGVGSFSFNSPDGSYKTFSIPKKAPGANRAENFYEFERNNPMLFNVKKQKLGIKIQDTEEGNGVKILDVDEESPAETAGIKKDDILTELNGNKITNSDEAREQLMLNADKNSYPVKIKRSGSEITLTVKIPKKLKTADL